MSNEETKPGILHFEVIIEPKPLREVLTEKVNRLKAHLEAAFAMPCETGEQSRLKRIAIKRAALAIADSCDVVVSDLYEGEKKADHVWHTFAPDGSIAKTFTIKPDGSEVVEAINEATNESTSVPCGDGCSSVSSDDADGECSDPAS